MIPPVARLFISNQRLEAWSAEGKLALSENADSRTLPGKAITTADIAAF